MQSYSKWQTINQIMYKMDLIMRWTGLRVGKWCQIRHHQYHVRRSCYLNIIVYCKYTNPARGIGPFHFLSAPPPLLKASTFGKKIPYTLINIFFIRVWNGQEDHKTCTKSEILTTRRTARPRNLYKLKKDHPLSQEGLKKRCEEKNL